MDCYGFAKGDFYSCDIIFVHTTHVEDVFMMRCIRREQFFCFYLSMMRRLIGQVKPRIIIIHLWLVKMVEKTIMKEAEFQFRRCIMDMEA